MKKIFILLLLLVAGLNLSACSEKETTSERVSPEKVATKYLVAYEEYDYDTMSLYTVVSEDVKNKAINTRLAKKYNCTYEEIENDIFEGLSEDLGVEINSYEEMSKELNKARVAKLKELYGEDYSIDVRISDSKKLSEDELEDMIETASSALEPLQLTLSDFVDTSQIKKGMSIQATVSCTGSKSDEPDTDSYTVLLGFVEGEWKVFSSELSE